MSPGSQVNAFRRNFTLTPTSRSRSFELQDCYQMHLWYQFEVPTLPRFQVTKLTNSGVHAARLLAQWSGQRGKKLFFWLIATWMWHYFVYIWLLEAKQPLWLLCNRYLLETNLSANKTSVTFSLVCMQMTLSWLDSWYYEMPERLSDYWMSLKNLDELCPFLIVPNENKLLNQCTSSV